MGPNLLPISLPLNPLLTFHQPSARVSFICRDWHTTAWFPKDLRHIAALARGFRLQSLHSLAFYLDSAFLFRAVVCDPQRRAFLSVAQSHNVSSTQKTFSQTSRVQPLSFQTNSYRADFIFPRLGLTASLGFDILITSELAVLSTPIREINGYADSSLVKDREIEFVASLL